MLGFIIIIILAWVYYFQYYKVDLDKHFLDDILPTLNTGDLIVFKAYNNFNSIVLGAYYGHLGVVYVKEGIPYIFEANGVEHMPLKEHHSKSGIFLTKVKDRIQKYKGRVFLKRLSESVPCENIQPFDEFIKYCLDNFQYDTRLFRNAFKKALGDSCNDQTNCGELAFLSLIKLGILPIEEYDHWRVHYLNYITSLEKNYEPMIEIIDHPFDS